jgi:hypothetical protein
MAALKESAMSVHPAATDFDAARPCGALVSKVDPVAHADRFLHVIDAGGYEWVVDPDDATPFPSMREAARMAVRLPSSQRAFGVPAH